MDRDIEAAQVFNSVCNISEEDIMNFTGISHHRLCTMVHMNLLSIECNEKHIYYRTTVEGRALFETKTGINGYYSNSYEHDKKLFEVYSELTEQERNSWRTEVEQRQYAIDHDIELENCSITDGAYMNSDGDWTYVEIVTDAYTPAMIQMKQNYVKEMKGTYEQHHV